MGIYTLSFSSAAVLFPEGSYMLITIDSQFTIMDDYCKEMSGFIQGSTLATSNLLCRRESSNSILITGYGQIAAGTALSFTLYLQITYNSLNSQNVYGHLTAYDESGAQILSSNTAYINLNIVEYGGYTLQLEDQMYQPLQQGNSQ